MNLWNVSNMYIDLNAVLIFYGHIFKHFQYELITITYRFDRQRKRCEHMPC